MSEPLLRIEDLRIEAEQPGRPPLLAGLSFDLAAGERLAIVGESGSGKTLATRAIPGLLPPGVRVTGGRIRFQGRELLGLRQDELRTIRGQGVGLVFQEPMTSLNPALTIGRQLAEGLMRHRPAPEAEIRRLCVEMLRRVAIPDAEACLRRFPHEFSGGMRQRIMLGSVLLLKPRLLIADEPTTALDTLSQREVLELMVELTRETETALLLITHDLGLVAQYTERVLVLEKGVLVEAGATQQVLARPSHPYTAKLVGSLPKPAGERSPPRAAPLLELTDLAVEHPGRPGLLRAGPPKRVLDGVNLTVHEGEIVALVGASGSGKTTLGRAAMGLKSVARGSVRFRGADLASMGPAEMRRFRGSAQLVFQDPFSSLDPRMRIGEIVAAGLRHTDLDPAGRRQRVAESLREVGLEGFEHRFPHQMSGGQRQRIAIARAMAPNPQLVVADEPVSALDLTIQLQVLTLLQRLQAERGFACLFITHDLAVVRQIADRVVVLEQGRIVEEGPAEAILASPVHPYTRRLVEATPSFAALELSKAAISTVETP
jgi:peptide/nickel transport system ATP-binding protein